MEGKIALEEHFSTELNNKYWDAKGEEDRNGVEYTQDVKRKLADPDLCVAEMDRAGIEVCIMSLTSPGVQSIIDPEEAVELARSANDYAHSFIQKHPTRLTSFASVALQNPEAAADELERAVTKLGLKGVLINGYTNVGPDEKVQYLDEAPLDVFWERMVKLNVPMYLHPREPLPSQRRSIQGYPELVGSAWGFGYETASHAVRLMLSGLFDRYPTLQVILGHLGEGLPYMLPRLQHRLDMQRFGAKGSKAKHRVGYYLANNFHLTTSGHFHSKPLLEAIEQVGIERVMFSTDYPYEHMDAGSRWFDDLLMDNQSKLRIGRDNANKLFSLGLPPLSESFAATSAS
ncbi:amidohydrolase family protein [Neisseria zalophi]|uniref:Amidohydrolase n=1 Tax=Neisseria zalophi TaxID=640030 RepID=A0A5J6PRW7_9NEIS|nr:amidohydrolase family protein [Neisseria zalophi]QEY25225.1 amidohydrolase [Neisseria zalophi]